MLKTIELYTLNEKFVFCELYLNKTVSKKKKKNQVVSHTTARMIPYHVSLSLKYSRVSPVSCWRPTQTLPRFCKAGMV